MTLLCLYMTAFRLRELFLATKLLFKWTEFIELRHHEEHWGRTEMLPKRTRLPRDQVIVSLYRCTVLESRRYCLFDINHEPISISLSSNAGSGRILPLLRQHRNIGCGIAINLECSISDSIGEHPGKFLGIVLKIFHRMPVSI